MTTLVLVRHGRTAWNAEGRYQGQADPGLDAKGRRQAEELARRLADEPPELVCTSPLRRARQTADAIVEHLGLPLVVEPRLMEIHLGEWQGMLYPDIVERYGEALRRWNEVPWDTRPPGGETLEEVQRRVDAAVDDLVAAHPDRAVALVAHQLPLCLVKVRFQDIDPAEVRRLKLPNTHCERIEVP